MFDCVGSAWRAHEAELIGYLVRRLGDRSQADDLLQEIFLRAMNQGQGFCRIDNPRAWLFRVARNAVVDHVRTARPWVELPDDLAPITLEERAPVEELDACLAHNLGTLSEDDRNILIACDLQGQTLRAYAETRRLSLAAAKSRLLRARRRLRESLMLNCQVRFDETGRICCHLPRPNC